LRFEEFERHARAEWERIPEGYRRGVDGLVIERDAAAHPTAPDVYTLGECVTESYPSDFDGPDTIRSVVVLYYGSFRRLAALDSAFDWKDELWETLTHELQHHLEALADDEGLIDLDYAVDQNFKRQDGQPFDPMFFRAGEPIGDGVYRVERTVFIEMGTRDAPREHRFEWKGRSWRVEIPPASTPILYLTVEGVQDERVDELCLVVVREQSLTERIRAIWRRTPPEVAEAVASGEVS
jgi:hypothetical protein